MPYTWRNGLDLVLVTRALSASLAVWNHRHLGNCRHLLYIWFRVIFGESWVLYVQLHIRRWVKKKNSPHNLLYTSTTKNAALNINSSLAMVLMLTTVHTETLGTVFLSGKSSRWEAFQVNTYRYVHRKWLCLKECVSSAIALMISCINPLCRYRYRYLDNWL